MRAGTGPGARGLTQSIQFLEHRHLSSACLLLEAHTVTHRTISSAEANTSRRDRGRTFRYWEPQNKGVGEERKSSQAMQMQTRAGSRGAGPRKKRA